MYLQSVPILKINFGIGTGRRCSFFTPAGHSAITVRLKYMKGNQNTMNGEYSWEDTKHGTCGFSPGIYPALPDERKKKNS